MRYRDPPPDLNETSKKESKLTGNEDYELVRSAQKGDQEAFGELVRKYQRKIYSLAWSISGNHTDADDLAQEVFLKTFRAIGKFRFQSGFYTWLYRIALNTIFTARKKLNKHRHLELKPQLLELQGSPYLPNSLQEGKGDRELHRKEMQAGLREALDSLSLKHRTVVVMHDIEGIPHNEIARIVSCSEGTVRSRLHYARKKLQQQLKGLLSERWLE